MARLAPLTDIRSKSTSPVLKVAILNPAKSPRLTMWQSTLTTGTRSPNSLTTRKTESVTSLRTNPSVSLGSKLDFKANLRLKFKSPRLHQKVKHTQITLLENTPRPQSSAEVKVSVVRQALSALLKLAK